MGFIVSSTGNFSSGFVVMTVLAVIGAGSLLLLPKNPPHQETVTLDGKAHLAVEPRQSTS
jgi:hypothetical protein